MKQVERVVQNVRNITLKLRRRRLGHFFVAVTLLVVTLACREGEGVLVRRLTFEGVRQVSELELRLAVTTTSSSRLPWGHKTFFRRQDFDEDLKRLESFYASHGFADARVKAFRTVYNQDKSEMDLTIVVDEGAPTIVESLVFEGFQALPPDHVESLRSQAHLRAGVPRDQEKVQVVRGLALDELRDHGYPGAKVALSEQLGGTPGSVIVIFTATPGEFARFGNVVVQGNTTVDQQIILKQLAFRKGDPFKLTAIQTSQRRLYTLELFQFANVEVGDVSTTPGEVTTKVTVVEAPHRQFTFGVGYGSEDHARTDAKWRHVNFLGGARTAGVEAKYSALERGLRLSFGEPSLVGGVSLAASGQSWYASNPAYTLRTTGGRVGVLRASSVGDPLAGGTRARNSLSMSVAREYESYRVSESALADSTFRPTLISLGLNPLTGEGRGTVSALTMDLQRNTVANLLDARSGLLASVHAEAAGKVLGGDFVYREVSAEGRAYVSVAPSLVAAVHVRAGTIAGSGDPDTSVPFFKRYFLGGATSLRGWGRYEVAPLTAAGLPIGGYSMLESSGELRLTRGTSPIGLVVFADAGNVWGRSAAWKLSDLRTDVGAGLRYITPVGPVRFDVAYQLNPIGGLVLKGSGPGDYRRWRFHFSIGQAF